MFKIKIEETLIDTEKANKYNFRHIFCFFGFHTWTWLNSWEYNPIGPDFRTRACLICGKQEDRTYYFWKSEKKKNG